MMCDRQLFIFYSKTLIKIVVLETYLPTSLAYLMALSSMCWYCSIAAADRIKLGLVVASVGLYSFIAANIESNFFIRICIMSYETLKLLTFYSLLGY